MRPTRSLALAAVVLLMSSAPAHSQVLIGYLFGEKLASENFNMGFEVGMNFADFADYPDAERTNHPVFGLFADWRFSEHFHFGAAVMLTFPTTDLYSPDLFATTCRRRTSGRGCPASTWGFRSTSSGACRCCRSPPVTRTGSPT